MLVLPLKVMQLLSRDTACIPRHILGGIWREGMANSEAGLWHSAFRSGGITWPVVVKSQCLINRLPRFQYLFSVFMKLCHFGWNEILENMQESSLLLTARKLQS